jgi:hypothetical protein
MPQESVTLTADVVEKVKAIVAERQKVDRRYSRSRFYEAAIWAYLNSAIEDRPDRTESCDNLSWQRCLQAAVEHIELARRSIGHSARAEEKQLRLF